MADRRATALPLPDMLRREMAPETGSEVPKAGNTGKRFRAHKSLNYISFPIRNRTRRVLIEPKEGEQLPFPPAGWHVPPDSGHGVLDGSGATGRTADQIAQMGTGPSFLITRLFPT